MSVEKELKYCFSSAEMALELYSDPHLKQIAVQSWSRETLKTAYYDTEDRLLQRAGVALRVRSGPEAVVLCCKYQREDSNEPRLGEAPLALRQRQEDEIPLASLPASPGEVPWRLLPCSFMLERVLAGGELKSLASTDFQRQSLLLRWGESEIELALDEGFLSSGSNHQAFLELELELKQGSLKDLCDLGEQLAKRYSLIAEPRSKLQRALES